MKKRNIYEIQQLLKKMSFQAENLKPFMHTIGEKVVTSSMDAFESERDPITGENWSPTKSSQQSSKNSSKATQTFKRRKSQKKILRDQGTRGGLMASVDYEASSDKTQINVGKVYAATHHFGDEDRNIEQRRYLPFTDDGDLSDELTHEIIEEFEEHLFEEF